MVVAASLSHVQASTLIEVFNHAFGDYDVPLSMSEKELFSLLHSIDYSPEDSIGLFDDESLVGFLFVGRRGEAAYDGGTAIIPSYRGRGLAHTLIQRTIESLKARGCTSFTLEVLSTNTRAKNLYEQYGFTEVRPLLCYEGPREALTNLPTQLSIHTNEKPFTATARFSPSWQNANRSVNRGGYANLSLHYRGQEIGCTALLSERNSIAQLILHDPFYTPNMTKEALIACSLAMKGSSVRLINVDGGDTVMQQALEELGFELFATQSEMKRAL